MSEESIVYSFRLRPRIEDEQWALDVWEKWEARGIERRQLFIMALKALEGENIEIPNESEIVGDLLRAVNKLQSVVSDLQNGNFSAGSQGLAEVSRESSRLAQMYSNSAATDVATFD